jgi:uncharacterized protein YgbK (DUF1537 family)
MRGGLEVAVVADDLSGAAECAGAFGGRVVLGGSVSGSAVVLCTQSRDRNVAAASHAVREAALQLAEGAPGVWFKKVDSTLRGHVAAELAAMEAVVKPALTVVAPAFPAQGRVVRGGQVLVHGSPLGREVPVALRDAETDEDLDRIVSEGLADGRRVLWVGSGGLARRLALALGVHPGPVPLRPPAGPIAVVVGSAAPEAHEQLGRLMAAGVPVTDVILAVTPPVGESLSPAAAQALADRVAPLWPRLGGAILTGGETARAVLATVGATALRVVGEVEPGVPISLAEPHDIPVVTTAGAFGDPETLVRARDALRSA